MLDGVCMNVQCIMSRRANNLPSVVHFLTLNKAVLHISLGGHDFTCLRTVPAVSTSFSKRKAHWRGCQRLIKPFSVLRNWSPHTFIR
jgi:hypothetical protein